MGMGTIEDRIKHRARELGFSLSGIAPATDADGFDRFQNWLARGYHGEMAYLLKYERERRHPRGVLESVKSVVMVGLEYGPSTAPQTALRIPNAGKVAAYAQGPDYHRLIWDKLNDLVA